MKGYKKGVVMSIVLAVALVFAAVPVMACNNGNSDGFVYSSVQTNVKGGDIDYGPNSIGMAGATAGSKGQVAAHGNNAKTNAQSDSFIHNDIVIGDGEVNTLSQAGTDIQVIGKGKCAKGSIKGAVAQGNLSATKGDNGFAGAAQGSIALFTGTKCGACGVNLKGDANVIGGTVTGYYDGEYKDNGQKGKYAGSYAATSTKATAHQNGFGITRVVGIGGQINGTKISDNGATAGALSAGGYKFSSIGRHNSSGLGQVSGSTYSDIGTFDNGKGKYAHSQSQATVKVSTN